MKSARTSARAWITSCIDRASPGRPIDPGAWVHERGYNQRDLAESLERFSASRADSLEWLRSLRALRAPDLDRSEPSPRGGRFHAGDMLAAWVAHDLLHLRQLVELHYAWTAQQLQPYSVPTPATGNPTAWRAPGIVQELRIPTRD